VIETISIPHWSIIDTIFTMH